MEEFIIDEFTAKSVNTVFAREKKEIKVIEIIEEERKVTVKFENNHEAIFYKFGLDIYSVVSDDLRKSVIKELKADVESFFAAKISLEKLKETWERK
jgi:benzoyl-CoA reductase/2-hydroxyglutaryl-CoA dehydratase subunit BcrC/BadD/HgdB